jgi:hypothetical protein
MLLLNAQNALSSHQNFLLGHLFGGASLHGGFTSLFTIVITPVFY